MADKKRRIVKQLANAVVDNENGPVLSATNIHYEIA
jgi:hypothetical protein